MSAADRNKLLIAGGVLLVAIIVIVFLLRGRSARQGTTGAAGFAGPAQPAAAGAPAVGAGTGATAPGQAAPAAPGGAFGAGGAAGEQQVAVAPDMVGAVRIGSGPGEPTRRDPFVTFDPPPQPRPAEVRANLPPVSLQTGGLRPPGLPESLGQVARRRVAGLLFNDGAWAILEQDNEAFIVKPGDVVDGNRITAIGPEAIYVTDSDGRRWKVHLRSLAPGTAAPAGTVPGMPAMPPPAG